MNRRKADRGSVSLWVVMFAFITMILLTLVVDGGQVMVAKARAADIAEQAARASADDIDPASLRQGPIQLATDACDLTTGPAVGLVKTYGEGVGVNATLEGCQPGTDAAGSPDVTVQVQVSVPPLIPAPAFSSITVSASETAYLACGSNSALAAC
jgi:hypothetical protein